MTYWILLGLAILFELLGTTSMKLSDGFSRLWPSISLFVCYAIAFSCLTFALKKLELSMTYAIWSGVGTALTAVIGVFLFKETMNLQKLFFISLIIVGVLGLNLGSARIE